MDSLEVFAFFAGVELFSCQVQLSGVFSWQGSCLLSLFKMTSWFAVAVICIHSPFLTTIISY